MADLIMTISNGRGPQGPQGPAGADGVVPTPTNGGTFTGPLALNNINGTYLDDYNLATSGTITFVAAASPVLWGFDYFRIVSDGTTPFSTDANIKSVFNNLERVPSNYILEAGIYEVYMWQKPNGKRTINISEKILDAVPDNTPTASNVAISGTKKVGETLTGSYTYNDADGDVETTSTFKWYRADDGSGTNLAAISGATSLTYVLQNTDEGKYIRFGVIPVNAVASGNEAFSSYTTAIAASDVTDTTPPAKMTITNITLT